jgi:hypothetical protein
MVVVLLMAVLLMGGCSSDDVVDPNAPVPTVKAQLSFSFPGRIAKGKTAKTRMTGDVVQENGTDDEFRGIVNNQLFCYNQLPTASSNKLGNIIEVKTAGDDVVDDVTEDDYSLCQVVNVPVGTTYFTYYGQAYEEPVTDLTEHEKRMHYGIIERVGLGKNTYSGNSGIRFRPVQICSSTDELGGSPKGQALLNLLNLIMSKIDPAGNLYLNEAYQRMTQLTTLSSYNVQLMLGFILKMINQEAPDDQGSSSVQSVTNLIVSSCDPESVPDIQNGVIVLKENYQGFPADINLPDGAARIKWDETNQLFVIPDKQKYSNDLEVTSVNDYVYPMNLQYQMISDIVASDELVIIGEVDEDGTDSGSGSTGGDSGTGTDTGSDIENEKPKNWQDLIDKGYSGLDYTTEVKPTTQSVAMVKQVEYAVGRLAVRSRISGDYTRLPDANGNQVDVTNNPFTLKGYIVGGQREVDYNFMPVMSSTAYAIYDTDLNGGQQPLKRHYFTEPDYILGLGTAADKSIMIALELVNNGPAFQGADGVIVTGATFYLVANMIPKDSPNYTSGSLDQIFIKDRYTSVGITITSLATATYGLPNLEIPHPTVGLSVNLNWEEGLWYDDIPL